MLLTVRSGGERRQAYEQSCVRSGCKTSLNVPDKLIRCPGGRAELSRITHHEGCIGVLKIECVHAIDELCEQHSAKGPISRDTTSILAVELSPPNMAGGAIAAVVAVVKPSCASTSEQLLGRGIGIDALRYLCMSATTYPPAGPVGPCGPSGPVRPIGPRGPVGPCRPCGPREGPCAPRAPLDPCDPRSLSCPWAPVSPLWPWGPAAPGDLLALHYLFGRERLLAPGRPSAPVHRRHPWGLGGLRPRCPLLALPALEAPPVPLDRLVRSRPFLLWDPVHLVVPVGPVHQGHPLRL